MSGCQFNIFVVDNNKMRGFKIFALLFQAVQAVILVGFVISLFDWSWIKIEFVIVSTIAIFWLFLNIITLLAIAKTD